MPESPDFEQLAAIFRLILEDKLSVAISASPFRQQLVNHLVTEFAEQLRQVWNARGAADLDAVRCSLIPDVTKLERALRSLDR